jgi:putative redox protein
MKDSVQVNWMSGMAFEAEVDGYKINMDATEDSGGSGKGPRPKPLMMVALAGCTGMDVISLLQKMRVELTGFSLKTEGELTEEHPKYFTKMHIIYQFKGKDLPIDKLEKAISLSHERYCGVSASYRKAMEITYEIELME